MNKIEQIIEEMKRLEKELEAEIENMEMKFFYKIQGKKIYFKKEVKNKQKQFALKITTYLKNASLLNYLTVPVIWFCIIPLFFIDISASIYQMICFSVYRIPKVKRSDYVIIDRHALAYLNIIEKINCAYCSYFNGTIAYIQEIAARTEQYWCPIKHARKLATTHSRYHKFLDYGDYSEYQAKMAALRQDYGDLQ